MAQDSWPSPQHNNRAVNEDEYEALVAPSSLDGLVSGPLAPISANGSGMSVQAAVGAAGKVRGRYWAVTGAGSESVPIGAASSARRFDRVVLRLDRSTRDVRIAVRPGTPGGGPPSLVQESRPSLGLFEVPMARVQVDPGVLNIAAGKVVNEAWWGGREFACPADFRPGQHGTLTPSAGFRVYEYDTGRRYEWTGAAWHELGASTIVGRGSATTNVAITAGAPATLNLGATGVVMRKGRDYRLTIEAGIECSSAPPMNVEVTVKPGSPSNSTVLKTWRITHDALGSSFRETYRRSHEFTAGADEHNGSFYVLARSLAGGTGVFTDGLIEIREL